MSLHLRLTFMTKASDPPRLRAAADRDGQCACQDTYKAMSHPDHGVLLLWSHNRVAISRTEIEKDVPQRHVVPLTPREVAVSACPPVSECR